MSIIKKYLNKITNTPRLTAEFLLIVFTYSIMVNFLTIIDVFAIDKQYGADNGILYYEACESGSSSASSSSAGSPVGWGDVYVIGDSIMVGLKDKLEEKLTENGASSVTINASGGRNFSGGGATGQPGFQALEDDEAIIKEADTIIMAIGTNQMENIDWNVGEDAYVERTKEGIRKALDIIRGYGAKGKVLWVDVAIGAGAPPQYVQFGHWINYAIYQEAEASNYEVIPWTGGVNPTHNPKEATGPIEDPNSYLPDGIHPTGEGQDKYVDIVINFSSSNQAYQSECCAEGGSISTDSSIGPAGFNGNNGKDSIPESSISGINVNELQIYNFFREKGFSEAQAAGILGNIAIESYRGDPSADNGPSYPNLSCRGIVQWCYERKDRLFEYAKEKGLEWDHLGLQLDYLWQEVVPGGVEESFGMIEKIKEAKTAKEASYIFHDTFERSEGGAQVDARATEAERLYELLTGTSASSSSTNCSNESTSDAGYPTEDREGLIKILKEMIEEGKVDISNSETHNMHDIENWGDEYGAGAQDNLLRAIIAIQRSTGATIYIWNFNTQHPPGGQHSKGLASDLAFAAPGGVTTHPTPGTPNNEEANKVWEYIHEKSDLLKIDQTIWHYPDDDECLNKGKVVSCRTVYAGAGDHSDHIHFSVEPDN